jgi:hypothetical protein
VSPRRTPQCPSSSHAVGLASEEPSRLNRVTPIILRHIQTRLPSRPVPSQVRYTTAALSWSFLPFSAFNSRQRLPIQRKRLFDSSGLPPPDSATPSGFLNLLTSCSVSNPSSLVSCWWHSWAYAFEGFPSTVAVPSSHIWPKPNASPRPVRLPVGRWLADACAPLLLRRFTDFGIRRVRSRGRS